MPDDRDIITRRNHRRFYKAGPGAPVNPPAPLCTFAERRQPVDICPEESNIHQRPRSGWRRGLGVKVLSTAAQAQPGVCMHDLQGLRTPGGGGRERLDLLSLHVRRSAIAAGNDEGLSRRAAWVRRCTRLCAGGAFWSRDLPRPFVSLLIDTSAISPLEPV